MDFLTSSRVGHATRSLYVSSGPRAKDVPTDNNRGRGSGLWASSRPLRRFGQVPSYSLHRLVNQSVTL